MKKVDLFKNVRNLWMKKLSDAQKGAVRPQTTKDLSSVKDKEKSVISMKEKEGSVISTGDIDELVCSTGSNFCTSDQATGSKFCMSEQEAGSLLHGREEIYASEDEFAEDHLINNIASDSNFKTDIGDIGLIEPKKFEPKVVQTYKKLKNSSPILISSIEKIDE